MKRVFMFLFFAMGTFSAPPVGGKTATAFGKAFPSPDAAAKALAEAAKSDRVDDLIAILGPSAKDIVSTQDPIADRKVRRAFAQRADEKLKVVPAHGRLNERTVIAGNDNWPLPIPIVQRNGRWYFDLARGKKEILIRRIGSNELDAIEICRGFVEAQNQYAAVHRTAAGVPYYAQKIMSTPGQRDGLYWDGQGENESPIGAIVARALAEGYAPRRQPYHGYVFRVLTAQGSDASGLPVNYIENGVMVKGFALIAWPAQYGVTGVMTFVVNKSGIVYQKDLGPRTAAIAAACASYDPDRSWAPVSGGIASLQTR